MSAVPVTRLSAEQKSRHLIRRLLRDHDHPCIEFPGCTGWHLVNADTDPEIQRCDACTTIVEPSYALTDIEASSLDAARDALHKARTAIADRRARAVANRRMALVGDDTLISPCCRQDVHIKGIAFHIRAFEIDGDTAKTVTISRNRSGDPDLIDPDGAMCSKCGRHLRLPADIEAVL